jgi:hypothetical protein
MYKLILYCYETYCILFSIMTLYSSFSKKYPLFISYIGYNIFSSLFILWWFLKHYITKKVIKINIVIKILRIVSFIWGSFIPKFMSLSNLLRLLNFINYYSISCIFIIYLLYNYFKKNTPPNPKSQYSQIIIEIPNTEKKLINISSDNIIQV